MSSSYDYESIRPRGGAYIRTHNPTCSLWARYCHQPRRMSLRQMLFTSNYAEFSVLLEVIKGDLPLYTIIL